VLIKQEANLGDAPRVACWERIASLVAALARGCGASRSHLPLLSALFPELSFRNPDADDLGASLYPPQEAAEIGPGAAKVQSTIEAVLAAVAEVGQGCEAHTAAIDSARADAAQHATAIQRLGEAADSVADV